MTEKQNINCHSVQEQMIDLMHNQVDEKERLEMENHIAQCADCQAEWAENQMIWQQLGMVKNPSPSHEMGTRFYAMLDTYKKEVDCKMLAYYEIYLGWIIDKENEMPIL